MSRHAHSKIIGPRDSSHVPNLDLDDTSLLSEELSDSAIIERDLSPDVLATGLPFSGSPHQHQAQAQAPQSDSKGLVLRSSRNNITGVSNITTYAFPIKAEELTALLEATRSDLQSHDPNSSIAYYQCNTTQWSFSVIAPNEMIRHAAIQAIVSRYIKLAPATPVADIPNMFWARAGALFRSNRPIADTVITPILTTFSSTSTSANPTTHSNPPNPTIHPPTNQNISTISQPIEIITYTPSGPTCSFQLINESAALAAFSTSTSHPQKRSRSIEAQLFAHAAQTIYGISLRLWRDPDGLPVQMSRLAAIYVVLLAIDELVLDELRAMGDGWDVSTGAGESEEGRGGGVEGGRSQSKNVTVAHNANTISRANAVSKVDTGPFTFGSMQTRLWMKIFNPEPGGHFPALSPSAWRDLLSLILHPLQALKDQENVWAMEGEIYAGGLGGEVVGGWCLSAFASSDDRVEVGTPTTKEPAGENGRAGGGG